MDYHLAQIAELYDAANPWSADLGFYVSLAGSRPLDVLDLGCGTGTLCCALAAQGHRVTGVDPAEAMLNIAQRKPHAQQVEWIHASAQNFCSDRRFDLAVMTGNAFQVLLKDDDIAAALDNIRGHLNRTGRLTFETRNPAIDWATEWAARPPALRILPNGDQCIETMEITAREAESISFRTLYRFADKTITTESTLRFPSRDFVESQLNRRGFHVQHVFGDWDSGPFSTQHSREIIFVAKPA